jgi:hypothetical protein
MRTPEIDENGFDSPIVCQLTKHEAGSDTEDSDFIDEVTIKLA